MPYEHWIDRQCVCGVDFDYYIDQAGKLAQLCRDYLNVLTETDEGRYLISELRLPDCTPLSWVITHRRILQRLHSMVDFLCRLEVLLGCPEDGWMIEKRRAGVIVFIPPTEVKYSRPEYGWHWDT